MSSKSILTQHNSNGNTPARRMADCFVSAFCPTQIQPNTAYITAACDLRATSGLVIPKGTYGRLLEIDRHGMAYLDFGAAAVYAVAYGSALICWNGGER